MGNRRDYRLANTKQGAPPGLELLFAAHVEVADPVEIGQSAAGRRLVMTIEPGGRIAGPLMNGRTLPGSMIINLVRSDGIVETEAHTIFEMDDGHRILGRTNGLLAMSAEAVQELADGRPYDPTLLYARTFVRFEAADEGPYAWLNHSLCISTSTRTVDGVDATVWRIL